MSKVMRYILLIILIGIFILYHFGLDGECTGIVIRGIPMIISYLIFFKIRYKYWWTFPLDLLFFLSMLISIFLGNISITMALLSMLLFLIMYIVVNAIISSKGYPYAKESENSLLSKFRPYFTWIKIKD